MTGGHARDGNAVSNSPDGSRQATMIDLYGCGSPNVLKIHIVLEELDLPYREHLVDIWRGDQFKPEFLRVNPNGKVPVIVDQDGPGGRAFTVFESGAILVYLADKTGRLMSDDRADRSTILQWLMVQMTAVGPMFGQYHHFQ